MVRCGSVGMRIGIALEVSSSSSMNIHIPYERKDEEPDLQLLYQDLFPIQGVLVTIVICGLFSHQPLLLGSQKECVYVYA